MKWNEMNGVLDHNSAQGWAQPGPMKPILVWNMPQVQDRPHDRYPAVQYATTVRATITPPLPSMQWKSFAFTLLLGMNTFLEKKA